MWDFEHKAAIKAQHDQVAKQIYDVLTGHGFRVDASTAHSGEMIEWRFEGPGLQSTRQDPIRGASLIEIRCRDRQLFLNAELGYVERMKRFMRWFPLSLGLGIGLILGIVFGLTFGDSIDFGLGSRLLAFMAWVVLMLVAGLIPVIPWLVIGPMIGGWLDGQTRKSLTTLASNAANLPI